MEVVVTAIMGEIANRSISFLIDKYSKQRAPTTEDERLHNLRCLLLCVRVIVEEAEGYNITNQGMVRQLNMMRKEMYRGYFAMDSFRSHATEEKSKDHGVSHRFALSEFSPAKRLFFSNRESHMEKEGSQVLNNLNNIIADASEFVTFLKNYPPLFRQPYSMHLILEKCMFGRQMEMERIMRFLILVEPQNSKNVGVLPIVGPAAVGKSTLVAHVCKDERVRSNFTQIVLIDECDPKGKVLNTFKGGGHQNNSLNGDENTLAIIEFSEDVNEDAWKRYLACSTSLARNARIIITSRSSKIVSFGTTEALILNRLPMEAYWYFFKVLTFGSADPKDQTKMESVAMEICKGINGSFVGANVFSCLLKADHRAQHWFMVREILRILKERKSSFCGPDAFKKMKPTYFRRISNNDYFAVYPYHECFSGDMVPKTTVYDVLFGSVKCEGRFEVLGWKSLIPPYKKYIYTCNVRKMQHSKKERHVNATADHNSSASLV
ncbi:hypothetical protein EJB05_54226, partial [Eragrostis curvula]